MDKKKRKDRKRDKESRHQPAPENRVLPQPKILFTVGIGKRPLQQLLQMLVDNRVELVADVRTYAAESGFGFTRERDLALLLKEIAGIEYRREEVLVPTREMREQFRRDKNWSRFEAAYRAMIEAHKIETQMNQELFAENRTALLGDPLSPEQDYRRLAAEYLKDKWGITELIHL